MTISRGLAHSKQPALPTRFPVSFSLSRCLFWIQMMSIHRTTFQGANSSFFQIWQAVSQSPGWNNILLIITYDEHGGCYDHVLPRLDAAIPDAASDPGKEGFQFDRFGVRVPTVMVSPFIQAGTVFRSDTNVPYDHTSILATLRDWLPISEMDMLPSKRIDRAPNVGQVLTLPNPREVKPTITSPRSTTVQTSLTLPPNDLQKTLVAGAAYRFGMDAPTVLAQITTRQHAVDFFKQRISMARL